MAKTSIRIVHDPFVRSRDEIILSEGEKLREALPEQYQDFAIYRVSCSSSNDLNEAILDLELHDGEEIIVQRIAGIEGLVGAIIGAVVQFAVRAIISYALNFAISALLGGDKQPKPSYGSGGKKESPTYGWDGIRSTSNVGIPVSVIYGKHKVGGNYINAWIEENQAKKNEDYKSYMNVLIGVGEGPLTSIAGINFDVDGWNSKKAYVVDDYATDAGKVWKCLQNNTDRDPSVDDDDNNTGGAYWEEYLDYSDKIKIDGNPIGNFRSIQIFTRMGNDSQTVCPGFEQLHDLKPQSGIELRKNRSYVYTTEGTDVEQIRIHFIASACISFDSDEEDGTSSHTIEVKIEYRVHDSGDDWTEWDTREITRETMSQVRFYSHITDLAPNQYDLKITQLSAGTKDGARSADLSISNFDEIRNDSLTYPYTGLLGLRLCATNQLSGTLGDVTFEVEGLKVDVYANASGDPSHEYSRNPIWCIRDLLLSERYGLGSYYSATDLSADWFQESADYCDETISDGYGNIETRFLLDLVIDSEQPALDLLLDICRTFRGLLIPGRSSIRVIVDKPETPVKLFGMGNIVKGSFKEEFASFKETPNVVEVQFRDAENDYERTPIQIEDEASLLAGEQYRKHTLQVPGISRYSQARRIGRYFILSGKHCPRIISFKTGQDGVGCLPGQVIRFAHDVPQWGVSSGRISTIVLIISGEGSGLPTYMVCSAKLSMPVTLAEGSTYYIEIRRPDDSILTGTIMNEAGSYDAGENIVFYYENGEVPPSAYCPYSIGLASLVTKPYRVISISDEPNWEVQLTCHEYYAGAYDESGFYIPSPPNYSHLRDPRRVPAQVLNLTATPVFTSNGAKGLLSWNIDDTDQQDGLYNRADIYQKMTNGEFKPIGTTYSNSFNLGYLNFRTNYTYKVVAISQLNVSANKEAAPTVSLNIDIPIPLPIQGLEVRGQGNWPIIVRSDIVIDWKPLRNPYYDWPAGEEPNGFGTCPNNPWLDKYKIIIFGAVEDSSEDGVDPTRIRILRTAFTTDTTFTYSREMNKNDGKNGFIHRDVAIYVYGVDRYGQMSSMKAETYVLNPKPSAPVNFVWIQYSAGGAIVRHEISWEANSFDDSNEIAGYQLEALVGVDWVQLYDGPGNKFIHPGTSSFGGLRVRAYDYFDKSTPGAWNDSPSFFDIPLV